MKKVLVLLAIVLGATNMYAQDYDLQRLAKIYEKGLYDEWHGFHDGRLLVQDYDTITLEPTSKFYDRRGNVVFGVEGTCSDFSEGLAAFNMNNKYGFVDVNGNKIVPPTYDEAKSFINGLAIVKKNGKYGAIDKNGKIVIPCVYDYLEDFKENLAYYRKGKQFGVVDRTNKVTVIPSINGKNQTSKNWDFIVAEYLNNRLASQLDDCSPYYISNNGKRGYVDKMGKMVFSITADRGSYFHEGFAAIVKNNLYGYIDKNGKEIIQPQFTDAKDFSDGLAAVKKDGLYGYIDMTGNLVIPYTYKEAKDFKNGYAVVGNGNYYGYIDKTGNAIAICVFSHAEDFSDGLALVRYGDKNGFIDIHGNNTFNINVHSQSNSINAEETLPSFKGGQEALNRWISENMQYPQDAYNDGIQGRVKVSVEINSDGSIGDVSIVKSVHPSLDKEAIRLFKSMPKWNPGTQNGNPVSAKMVFPLNFKLE